MDWVVWRSRLVRGAVFILNSPLIALIVFTFFWSGLLIHTGTLTSGYHFVDDHEMIRINADLQQSNFFSVNADWLSRDFGLRFRPVYIIHRILTVQLLGPNFLLFSIQNLVLAILTSWLLYMFCRQIGFKSIAAYLFPFLGLVGAQAAIWWRLGPNETIGIFLFALGLYFISLAYKADHRSKLHKALAVGFFVLASLAKESFIMMLPAVLVLNYYLFTRKYKTGIVKTILQNKWLNAVLGVLLAIEGAIVVFVVGANKIGYAGVDSQSFGLVKLRETFQNLASDSNVKLVIILGVIYAGLLLVHYILWSKQIASRLKQLLWVGLFFVLIVLPQVVLYTKSGIYERYMIPGVLGFALLSVFFFQQGLELIKLKWLKLLATVGLLALIAVLFYPYLKLALINAYAFTADGQATAAALAEVAKVDSNATIVIVADPVADFENGYSLNKYLILMQHKSNIYLEPLSVASYDTKFEQGLNKGFVDFVSEPTTSKLRTDIHVSAFFVFKNVEQKFLTSGVPFFSSELYVKHKFGNYVVYTRSS